MESNYRESDLKELFNRETRDALLEFWYKPLITFAYDNSDLKWDHISAQDILKLSTQKKMVSKIDITDLCAKAYSDSKLLAAFYHSLSEHDQRIVYLATWQVRIEQRDLEKLFGGHVWSLALMNHKSDLSIYYGRVNISLIEGLKHWKEFLRYTPAQNPYYFGNTKVDYEKILKLQIQFPQLLRYVFASAIPKPEGYYFEETQLGKDLITFSFEKQIFNDLPIFMVYYAQKNLTFTQKGAPNQASVRKMDKTLKLEQFPTQQDLGLRNSFIAGLFSDTFKISREIESPLSLLKRLFDPMRSQFENRPLTPFLLAYLSGIRNISTYYFDGKITANIFEIFKALPVDVWVSKENLSAYAESHFTDLKILNYNSFSNLVSEIGERQYLSYNSSEIELWHHLQFPNFIGHAYLLAAFGLMEIAIDPKVFWEYSYYDDFIACKLTKLGAYVLGQSEAYDVPESQSAVKIILEEDSLTIRTEGNTSLAEVLLQDYLQKISENKFQLNSEIFLKDCNSEASVIRKIKAFKQAIQKQLPPLWEQYFERLVKNSQVIKMKSDYSVFKLRDDDRELIRIVAQDPELKKIIIKAEQFHVVVKRSNSKEFVLRMKYYGYLVGG